MRRWNLGQICRYITQRNLRNWRGSTMHSRRVAEVWRKQFKWKRYGIRRRDREIVRNIWVTWRTPIPPSRLDPCLLDLRRTKGVFLSWSDRHFVFVPDRLSLSGIFNSKVLGNSAEVAERSIVVCSSRTSHQLIRPGKSAGVPDCRFHAVTRYPRFEQSDLFHIWCIPKENYLRQLWVSDGHFENARGAWEQRTAWWLACSARF